MELTATEKNTVTAGCPGAFTIQVSSAEELGHLFPQQQEGHQSSFLQGCHLNSEEQATWRAQPILCK